MSELQPCPFCGSEAETDLAGGYAPQVFCTNKSCSVFIMDIDGVWLDDVIHQWNNRIEPRELVETKEWGYQLSDKLEALNLAYLDMQARYKEAVDLITYYADLQEECIGYDMRGVSEARNFLSQMRRS